MTVTVRDSVLGDRERLIDLFRQLNQHEDAVTGDRRTDRAAAEENFNAVTARLARHGGRFLVAEAEGEVAGLLVLLHRVDDVYVREERRRYALIADIVVDEARRRLGIGRALLDAAEAAAVAEGYSRLLISVLAGNAAAETAYARQGFRPLAHDLEKVIGPDI